MTDMIECLLLCIKFQGADLSESGLELLHSELLKCFPDKKHLWSKKEDIEIILCPNCNKHMVKGIDCFECPNIRHKKT